MHDTPHTRLLDRHRNRSRQRTSTHRRAPFSRRMDKSRCHRTERRPRIFNTRPRPPHTTKDEPHQCTKPQNAHEHWNAPNQKSAPNTIPTSKRRHELIMKINEQLALSILTTGKLHEPPSPEHPAGRTLVVQRSDNINANFTLPSGQLVSVYPWFIPRNPRTERQQYNRHRLSSRKRTCAKTPSPPQAASSK